MLPQKPKEYDYLFIKNLMKVTDNEELKEILDLVSREDQDISLPERMKIELFMLKVKNQIGTWKDSVYGLYQNYDMDVFNLMVASKIMREKLGVDYIPRKTDDLTQSGMF